MFLTSLIFNFNQSLKNLTPAVVLIISLVFLILNTFLLIFFDRSYGSYQFVSVLFFGNSYFPFASVGFGIDGLSISFLLLTSVIVCLCVLTT